MGQYTIAAARALGWDELNHGEAKVAMALSKLGWPPSRVRTQFPLGPYRLDFALPMERVDIEADGWVHTSAVVANRDRKRDADLAAWGWQVVRIDTQGDVAVATVGEALRQAIADAGASAAGYWKRLEEDDRAWRRAHQ